jgi:hypothetical protein
MAMDLASAEATSLMPGVKANESGSTPDDQVPATNHGRDVGAYQVSPGALDDVNKAFGTSYTPDDLNKPAVNKDVAQKYLTLQVQRFGPRVGLEAYNAGPTRVAAGDVPQSSVDYAARALNVGGAGNMDSLGADAAQFKQMLGAPDASWLAPLVSGLNASRAAEKAQLEGVQGQQEQDYQTDRARVKTAFDASNKDDTTPWTQKPPPPETLQAFGSAGSIFAAIASAFTRTPAISAMNGMAAAINARRTGDQKAYEDAYKVWQDNTKLAIDRQKQASERLTQALSLMQTDSAHGFAMAKQIMQEHGDDRGLLLLEAGEYQKLGEANDARDSAALNLAINNYKIQHPGQKSEILTDPGTKDENGNPVQYIRWTSPDGTSRFTTLTNDPYTPKGASKMGAAPSPADKASVDQTAQMIAGYQMQPLTSFAMRSPWGQAVMAKVGELNPDYQSARYGEVNKALSSFATGKQGDITRSMNVGIQHLDSIDELGQALKNGDQRTVNSVANRVKEEFGVAAPITFDAAKQIVADEIVKAIVGYSGAVNDRESMQKKLSEANSPEQLLAVTKEFRTLMAGQLRGLKKQYEDATGFTKGPFAFDSKLLPATKRELGFVEGEGGAKQTSAPPPPPGPHATVFTVTPEQAKSLPPGTYYRGENDPPGAYRFKP